MNTKETLRFQAKTLVSETGCIEWTGAITPEGYGQLRIAGRVQYAHRIAYEHAYGPITSGHVIDHLCRNRKCVNPKHLEAVTHRENIIRGTGPTAIRAQMNYCIQGHPLSGDNLYVKPNGNRVCKACKNERQNKQRLRERQ